MGTEHQGVGEHASRVAAPALGRHHVVADVAAGPGQGGGQLVPDQRRQPTFGRDGSAQVKTFTARAITRPSTAMEISDWTAMAILAQGTSGMTSVGLNAADEVSER